MLSPKAIIAGVTLLVVGFGASLWAGAASINGEIKFLGDPPKRPPIQVSKDQEYCGTTLPDDSYLLGPASVPGIRRFPQ